MDNYFFYKFQQGFLNVQFVATYNVKNTVNINVKKNIT